MPQPAGRVTPRLPRRGPFRPAWHKVVGVVLVLAGIGLFVINDLEFANIHLIPGGHNELWAIVAVGVAASSTWWFGLYDRPSGRWD